MHRGLIIALLLASASGRAAPPPATLTAKEITTYFEPYVAGVRGCYLASATEKEATGALRLELVIHRNGMVEQFAFAAPGVSARPRVRLDDCLRALAKTWHFPERRGFTSAVIPFLFQRTNVPGAGPIESCWDPRGCPPGRANARRQEGTP